MTLSSNSLFQIMKAISNHESEAQLEVSGVRGANSEASPHTLFSFRHFPFNHFSFHLENE
jgi:hypothetical protein